MSPHLFSRVIRFLTLSAILGSVLAASGTAAAESRYHVGIRGAHAEGEVRCTARFSEDALAFGELGGYTTVEFSGCGSLVGIGNPRLPAQTIRIALPAGMEVTGLRIEGLELRELFGEYSLYPAQPPRAISPAFGPRAFVGPDPAIYESADPFPGAWAELVGQTDLAGQNMAVVRVHPLRYRPAAKRLTLATSLEIVLEGVSGYTCGDYLPAGASDRARRTYERMLAGMVVNPEHLELATRSGLPPITGVEPGEYEYVIITHGAWVDDFEELARWRTKKGISTAIVATSWIYNEGGYAGSDLEKIRAFVVDAHANWGATCFLLGGDTLIIPYHIRTITVPGYETADIPNDTYYADYDEDWTCEVYVARAPVRTPADIATFIDKVLSYEKNPPLTGYAATAAFFGFDISTSGDSSGEKSKELIRDIHLPPAWSIDTEYDSEPGSHKADVLAYLDQGYHLINHHDHCNADCMGAGWISHGDLITTSDMSLLANGERQSILFAVGCNPADFTTATSVAEAFVKNAGGGGIAFMGNTRTGWGGPPEDPDHYSAQQDRFFYRNLLDDGFERLGENFTDLKNDEFNLVDPYNLHKYCFTQLHLLGEPELTVWTEDPRNLTVTHDGTLFAGQPTTFVVEVECEGAPLEGAMVCLWKADDVYEVAETSAGAATFHFTAAATGTLEVTTCCRNHLPDESETLVLELPALVGRELGEVSGRPGLVAIRPNPFNLSTEIIYAVPPPASREVSRITIYDIRGRRVRTLAGEEKGAGLYRAHWDGRNQEGREAASGLYFCELHAAGTTDCRRLLLMR